MCPSSNGLLRVDPNDIVMGRLGDGHGHLDYNENEEMEHTMTMIQSQPDSYDPPLMACDGYVINGTWNIRASSGACSKRDALLS